MESASSQPPPRSLPLWLLPLAAGLLPAIAVLLALAQYAGEGGARCNPFIDDCVSISRMAREGAAQHFFRVLALPAGVLQVLTWLIAAHILATGGLGRRHTLALASAGVCAGIALIVYGSVLGVDGGVARGMRRWGTWMHFVGTYLAMLIFAGGAHRLNAARRLELPPVQLRMMLVLLAFIAAVGLLHLFAWAVSPALQDRIENNTEWWVALALTLNFLMVASLWWRWGLAATISMQEARRRQ